MGFLGAEIRAQNTMKTVDILSGLLLVSSASASNTCQPPGPFTGTPYSYVQPRNTTIVSDYGQSPAVYPSREYIPQARLG